MKNSGQAAFETIFLFLVIITAAILTISLYTSISGDTIALSAARAETNRQLAVKHDNIEIRHIFLNKAGEDININISLTAPTELDTNAIKKSISEKTTFRNIQINVQ